MFKIISRSVLNIHLSQDKIAFPFIIQYTKDKFGNLNAILQENSADLIFFLQDAHTAFDQ